MLIQQDEMAVSIVKLLAGLCIFTEVVVGYPDFQAQIPNGNSIPHPCNRSDIWPGVGHEFVQGQGPLNGFGRNFLMARKQWTLDLCKTDSDRDGKTNGEELGDPDCVWKPGQPNPKPVNTTLSHPGVCEPIDSPKCRDQNEFLLKIDSCLTALNKTKQHWCPAIKERSVKTLEFRFNNTVLPSNDTIYWCQAFDVPTDDDYQIIAWEPIIDNYELMHHLVMASCTPPEADMLNNSTRYIQPEACPMTAGNSFCQSMAVVWAFGQENRCYNNLSGILMGKSSFSKVVMQIHYNNPSMLSNVRDSSGIRLYYTRKARPYDTSMLMIGQLGIAIPPGQSSVMLKSQSFPDKTCSKRLFGPDKFYLTSLLFHMHMYGTHAKLVLRKSNGERQTLVDEVVTYDRPKFMVWQAMKDAPTLESGDDLEIECGFTTTDVKERYTFFGEKTSNEMCMGFIEIYPRPQNVSFHYYMSMGDVNACQLYDAFMSPNATLTLGSCSSMSFGAKIARLSNISTEGGLMGNCDPKTYPAPTCTAKCRGYMERNNFTTDPCIDGDIFRTIASFNIVPSTEDAYRVQSQMELCKKEILAASTTRRNALMPETTKAAGGKLAATSALILLAIMAEYLR